MVSGCGGSSRHPPATEPPLRSFAPGVGRGPAFRPPSLGRAAAAGRPIAGLRCTRAEPPRFGVHLELFAAGRVVLVPPGVGVAPPRVRSGAYVRSGRCSYPLRTREPTGVIEVARGTKAMLGELFAVWGQPLGPRRMAGFRGRVRAYVGGEPWRGDPRSIPLTPHAEIVLEIGPFVKPHSTYRFAPGL
jgi:hypothetical protein